MGASNASHATVSAAKGHRIGALSRRYGVARSTLYQWIRCGLLPAVRVGDVVIVLDEDWRDFLKEHRRTAASGSRSEQS